MNVPGKSCLIKVTQHIPTGEQCCHKSSGQWLVLWEGTLYAISPGNNLQKDIWQDQAKRETGKDQTDKLRWLCHECGTIQMP